MNEHLDRLARFKDGCPEYAGYHLLGGVAGVVVPEDVARYAYRQGLSVLAQTGDAVEIRNDGRFAAREPSAPTEVVADRSIMPAARGPGPGRRDRYLLASRVKAGSGHG